MVERAQALRMLDGEASALLTRLDRVEPFALHETMVPAAAPSAGAQAAIESHLAQGRAALREMVLAYRRWITGPAARDVSIAQAHRRLTYLRLRFNAVLSQLDIFADVITQRSEHDTGVWLAGMDVLATDALRLNRTYYAAPAVVCHLERGGGGAIRRARTRLPGGGVNPVAVVRVPRERMLAGSGIGSTLCHEVGHQGAALLDLVNSLKPELQRMQRSRRRAAVWTLFGRWISEILADFWSVATVGVAATIGLMGVVSLPRVFVFRLAMDDPHPVPWLRVKLSAAVGDALYPDAQWGRLAAFWEECYPLAGVPAEQRRLFAAVEAGMPEFVELVAEHRPDALRGDSLRDALWRPDRTATHLRLLAAGSRLRPSVLRHERPAVALAAVSQARSDGRLTPSAESRLLGRLLTVWALSSALDTVRTAAAAAPGGVALAT